MFVRYDRLLILHQHGGKNFPTSLGTLHPICHISAKTSLGKTYYGGYGSPLRKKKKKNEAIATLFLRIVTLFLAISSLHLAIRPFFPSSTWFSLTSL